MSTIKGRKALDDVEAYDRLARHAIDDDYDHGSEYSVQLYVNHHLERLNAGELLRIFGTAAPHAAGSRLFLPMLRLRRMGLYPENENECAALDDTIGEMLTDYVIAVRFNHDGEVIAVEMES